MRYLFFSLVIFGSFGIGTFTFAQGVQYTPLTTIPGLGNTSGLSTEDYVRALYMLSITVAGILAVVKIIFSGVKYMLTDVVTSKGDAIKDIRGALLGLLIVLGAVLILNTINPNLTQLSIFGNAAGLVQPTQFETSSEATTRAIQERPNVIFTQTVSHDSAVVAKYAKDCVSAGGVLVQNQTDSSLVDCRTK